MRQNRWSGGARRTALCGVLSAISAAMLYLTIFFPTARLAVAAAAGLLPVVAVVAAGRGAGYLCWASGSILGLLVCPEKLVVLLYIVFLGIYPVVKSVLEQRRSRIVEWGWKLAYFNITLAVLWLLLQTVFLPQQPADLPPVPLLWVFCNLVFVLYDIGLSRLISYYIARIAPVLGLK